MDKLFVYGIFLSASSRADYGMTQASYDTVKNFLTVGNGIVQAVPVHPRYDTALTGLVVNIPSTEWKELDRLEGGYDRVRVTTTSGVECYMYVAPGSVATGKEQE